MRLNIVSPYQSAAMLRMTHPFKELKKLYEVTESEDVDPAADVNIHVPLHTLAGVKDYGTGKHIAVYTHCNPGAQGQLYEACERADMITTMSFEGRRELVNAGIDPLKIWTIYSAADGFAYKKRLVLIVGYPQPNGRKRESILLDLAWQYDLTGYEFVLLGVQWEQLAEQLASLGVSVRFTHADNPDLIRSFYQAADVFIATGYVEGGPLPLLEAMASGVKVLSPRYGYAADLLDEADLYTTPEDLFKKLEAMFAHGILYHQLSRSWSWSDYVAEYALLIGRLTGASVDLYPERAMSRYVQLFDIIDREKPKNICEIGTWNGNNAIRMTQAAARHSPINKISYQGFDLFEQQTGEQFRRELSKAGHPAEVVRRRLEATGADIELVTGDTQDTIMELKDYADFYFVDGGHSEETIKNDGSAVIECMPSESVAIFDDYYHAGKPEGMGCNNFIDSLEPEFFTVTHLPVRTYASDGREIGMVQVKRANV